MHLETLTEQEIIISLIAIAFLLSGAYIFGNLFERIKAPRVVGEIVGGMFWGGSCLYFLAPDVVGNVFMAYEQEGKVLNIAKFCVSDILCKASRRLRSIFS